MGRPSTDRRYDFLSYEMCVRYGFCGGMKDGKPRYVDDFYPTSGPVTADEFADWSLRAEERDSGARVFHGSGLGDLIESTADRSSYDAKQRRVLRDLFVKHMGDSVVDVSELKSSHTIMGSWLEFRIDDLSGDLTQALVTRHLAGMHANSPPESVHAFDLDKLRQPGVTFWSGWLGDDIAVMGALKQLDADNGEIKSMRVADAFLGRGVGRAMLDHVLAEARRMGLKTLWLETGSTPDFDPALKLYESAGFTVCGPFADYKLDPFSIFMTRSL